MIKGIPFDFGDCTLIVPPLSLGTVEAMRDRIEKLRAGNDPNSIATVIDLALASLKRNYPDMTRERVADMVDFGNMTEIVEATMDPTSAQTKRLGEPPLPQPQPSDDSLSPRRPEHSATTT